MDIHNFTTLNELLEYELNRRVQVNPNYSLRALAKSLKLSPGELSEILRGIRPVSQKHIDKLVKAMNLSYEEKEYLCHVVQAQKSGRTINLTKKNKKYKISKDVFNVISQWYHISILALFDLKGFKWSSKFISEKLGISQTQSKLAMRNLENLKFVEKKGQQYITNENRYETIDQIPSNAIREFHRQMLQKATEALETQSIEKRDISGISFCCNKTDISKIKRETLLFQNNILSRYQKANASNLYHMEIALFSLLQGDDDE